MGPRRGWGLRTVALGALCAACAAAPASAAAVPSSAPQQAAVTNGPVNAIARGGGITYIGGAFDELQVNQTGLAQVNGVTGRYSGMPSIVDADFSAPRISAMEPDGAGGYYVGGNFSSIGGVARKNLAHVLADGTVDPNFNAQMTPGAVSNNTVNSLALSGGALYVGGSFSNIGGLPRQKVAKLSATSGNAFSSFVASTSDTVTDIEVLDGAVFISGSFLQVNGQARNKIAKLSTKTGDLFQTFDAQVDGAVSAIEVDASGLYVGGSFNTGPDDGTPNISIGGLPRNRLAKLSLTTGNAFSNWNPNADNIVSAIELSGSELFVGGNFDNVGGEPRETLAKLSATSGNAFTGFQAPGFAPQPISVVQIFDLAVSGGSLFVGGNFGFVGGVARNNAAKFSTTSGGLFSSFDPNLEPDDPANQLGTVFAVAPSGSEVAVGGGFTRLNRVTRHNLAALDENGAPTGFNPSPNGTVRALALSDTALYVGGSFASIGGLVRSGLSKVAPTSGNVFTTWDPAPDRPVLSLAVTDTAVYAGGGFTTIGTLPRSGVAKLSPTSGNVFSTFNANLTDPETGPVTDLAVDGTGVYAGGDFNSPDGTTPSIGGLPRNHIAKLSLTSGNAFSAWDPNANGPVRALALSGSVLYAGGDFIHDEGFDPQPSIGGQRRNHLAKLSTTSGNAFSTWDPNPLDTVRALAVDASTVYVGGDFAGVNSIGGQNRNKLAALSPTSGNAFSLFDPNMGTDVSNTVTALAVDGGRLFAGGKFPTVGGLARPNFAQFGP